MTNEEMLDAVREYHHKFCDFMSYEEGKGTIDNIIELTQLSEPDQLDIIKVMGTLSKWVWVLADKLVEYGSVDEAFKDD